MPQVPVPPEPEKIIGLKSDPDVWASVVLLAGGPISRGLVAFEHLEFLASVKSEGFKMFFDLWNGLGWWVVGAAGLVWLLNRFSKRNLPHERAPSWGLLVACAFIVAVFSSLATVQSSGQLPNIVVGWGGNKDGCNSTIDTTTILSFEKSYKLMLLCGFIDPTIDKMEDERIFVSNPFDIRPGGVTIVATYTPKPAEMKDINLPYVWHMPVLIPPGVPKEKISRMSDIEKFGGKLLMPGYYK
jgi:hypothetical protein